MTATAPGGRSARFSVSQGTFEAVFGFVYTALAVNAALVVTNLPLAVTLLLVPDPLASWPLLLLLSLTVAPSMVGAFAGFRAMVDDGPPRPVRAFWRGYRTRIVRAALLGAATAAVVGITMADLTAFAGTIWAPLLGPTLLVLALTTVAVAIVALAGFALYPHVSARAIVKAAVYLALRRWYFSVMALALTGITLAAVLVQPVLGAALVPGILLFAVWSNAHYSFTRLVETAISGRAEPGADSPVQ